MARFDLALKGGECVMPWGVVRADIGIHAGRIAAIGDLSGAEAAPVAKSPTSLYPGTGYLPASRYGAGQSY